MRPSGAFRRVPWRGLKVNTKVRIQLLTVGLAAKLLALLLLSPSLAAAVVLTVTDLGDTGGPGQLRTLIQAAAPGDTINIPAGTITLTPVGGYSVGLVIGKDLTISGAGAGATIIDGNGVSDSVIATLVLPTTVEISNLTIRNGVTNNIGGGINNGSNLLLTNVTLSGNTASVGGGIANTGTATLTNVTLSGNTVAGIQLGDGGGASITLGPRP